MGETMLAVMKTKPEPGLTVTGVPVPVPGSGDLLLRTLRNSICGTDVHIYDWDPWASETIRTPMIFGHEICGEVMEVGEDVKGFRAGDRVAVESHLFCGKCYQCLNGMRHICDHMSILGVHTRGLFSEYVTIPASVAWKVPSDFSPDLASIMEPLGNGVHVASAAKSEGQRIAVFGCGPTGLFALAAARSMGAEKVVAIDVNPHRLEMAMEVGADARLDGASEDLIDRIKAELGPEGPDVAFEMSGNAAAGKMAIRCLRKGGVMIAFGILARPMEINVSDQLILNSRSIVGVVGRRMFETWDEMQILLDSGRLDPGRVITHRFPLTEIEKGMEMMKNRDIKCGKVVLVPPDMEHLRQEWEKEASDEGVDCRQDVGTGSGRSQGLRRRSAGECRSQGRGPSGSGGGRGRPHRPLHEGQNRND